MSVETSPPGLVIRLLVAVEFISRAAAAAELILSGRYERHVNIM
jgi:hypothetical protein